MGHNQTLRDEGMLLISPFDMFSFDGCSPLAVREANDKLMNLHRCFIDPQGLPNRPAIK